MQTDSLTLASSPGQELGPRMQQSLAASANYTGIGVHCGSAVNVRLHPAAAGHGLVFVRVDLPGRPQVPAQVTQAHGEARHTVLRQGDAVVATPEHLLAALYACGVDNALIEIDAPELPIGDGSSQCWLELIDRCGVQQLDQVQKTYSLKEPVYHSDGQTHLVALPSDHFQLSVTLDYAQIPAIGTQYRSLKIHEQSFRQELATCRTFCLYEEVQALMERNLIQGGSLECAVVFDGDAVMNEGGLRYVDEPVRHKMLDLVGDLSLVARPFAAHVIAIRPGHAANVELARKLNQVLTQ